MINIKKHIIEYHKKRIQEGFTEEGEPDTKYYAFDWDDNIMFMPTKIMVLSENEDEIGMSTEDFAEHRHQIGKEPFQYKGATIVNYAPNPFRYFGVEGDKRFIIDCMTAPVGPSWNDFVECLNGGSIFAIITARGHTPSVLKEAVKNLIVSNKNGINQKELLSNLQKYENIIQNDEQLSEEYSLEYEGKELLERYLDRCMFAPVTYGEGSASNPEEGKIKAMRKFISYCKELANEIKKPGKFKNDVANDEIIPFIGFSDDDPQNIEKMNKFLEKEYPEKPVRTYLTKGGLKQEL
jgi:hypothetical protein